MAELVAALIRNAKRDFRQGYRMLFVVLFEDDPEMIHVRNERMADHLAFLAEAATTIRIAGSLRETPDASPSGACWVVEADSKAAVDKFCRADPFYESGLRRKYTIHHWSKAFDKLVHI